MQDINEIRVAFYIRVSTPEQWSKWYGLEFQLDSLNQLIEYKKNQDPKWVTHKKWIYEDSWFSGWDLNRPAYTKMLEDAKNWEFDMIVVWKIDRMSRNLSHLLSTFEQLKKYWVGFYSIKENIDFSWPIWKLTFQIFWALAEFEREMIRSRTVEGKIASAKSWNYVKASAPFGYKKVKNSNWKWSSLKIVKKEMDIVKKIFEWFIYEDLSYSDIFRKLNEMKVPKWIGWIRKNIEFTKWYETTVKDVLTTKDYTWSTEWSTQKDWEVFEMLLLTPKIISKNLFNLAQIKVKEVEEAKKWGKRKYLLSWKIHDVESWRKLIWVHRTKWGHSYRLKKYTNYKGIEIQWKEFPGKSLDEFVWGHILEFIKKPDRFFKIYKKETSELRKIDIYREEIHIMNQRIDEQELIKENIERKELAWRLSEEKANKYIIEANKVIADMRNRIKELEDKIEYLLNLELTESVIKQTSENFKNNIGNLTLEQKIRLVDILVEIIYLTINNEWDMEVEIIFKFDLDSNDRGTGMGEPKNSLNKQKNTQKDASFFDYGTPGRDRTHANPGPRPGALPLSYGCM